MTSPRMDKIRWVVAALVLLSVGAGVGYWWGHRAMPSAPTTAAADSSGDAAPAPGKRKVLYWHDAMVPNVKFDKPGKSPFMDMQLVPVYADEAGEGGGVRVSPSIVQNLGIRLGKVEKVALPTQLQTVGDVVFDEGLLELVQSRVEGYVTRLHDAGSRSPKLSRLSGWKLNRSTSHCSMRARQARNRFARRLASDSLCSVSPRRPFVPWKRSVRHLRALPWSLRLMGP